MQMIMIVVLVCFCEVFTESVNLSDMEQNK